MTHRDPGRHGVFPPEVRAQVTALACSLPRVSGTPLARWSPYEIARRLVATQRSLSISISTVRRWLQAEKLRPWRYHAWQHIVDPVAFVERARPILWLYEEAVRLLHHGTWVVCVDEKTSIQAREAEQPPQAAIPGQPMRQSPRYHRRGACHLFALLSVADGQVAGQCAARKRFVDFQAFVRDKVIPQAIQRGVQRVALILDNGPTHAPKQLEQWLHEQTTAQGWNLSITVYWLPTNASWLDQIEIWLSILQRKLLQPNHFTSTAQLEQAIQDFIAYYNQTAKPIQWTYTSAKLERKLGTN